MIYKGINIIDEPTANNIKQIKDVIDRFINGERESQIAIIDYTLKAETKNLKLFSSTFAKISEFNKYNFICETYNGYVVTNTNNQIVYIHPNTQINPTKSIDEKGFIPASSPKTQVLSTNEIMDLWHIKTYLNKIDNEMEK